MTYKELARISVLYGADFSAAINYCSQDCTVVKNLDEKLCLSDLKLALADRCKVPLSWTVNQTVAQCITALLQKLFRERGFCVPYNIAKSQ